jgi:hypothetical protein
MAEERKISVVENNIVDGIAIGDDKKTLIMLITDHLNWEGEFEFDHLVILQDKINSYARFIESNQYVDVYPDTAFNKFCIEMHFMHKLKDNGVKFIDVVNKQLSPANIEIVPIIIE